MSYAIRAYEEAPGQGRRPLPGLRVVSRQVRAGDLIRSWIEATIAERGAAPAPDTAARHVHPDELALHPGRDRRRRARRFGSDPERAHAAALAALHQGQIVLLVDDRQIEHADALIGLTETSEVTFLRLVPLVGG